MKRGCLWASAALAMVAAGAQAQYAFVDLHPLVSGTSSGEGGGGIEQVGRVDAQAALWTGTAATWISLMPSAAYESAAYCTDGTSQGGYVMYSTDFKQNAALWSGSAASFLNLHPAGYDQSYIRGIAGARQAGTAYATVFSPHAALWNGSAASFVDLHPSGAVASQAFGVSATEVVGSVTDGLGTHAAQWLGATPAWNDLTPGWATAAALYATDGTQQVGATQVAGMSRATVWNGTAASAVDVTPAGADFAEIRAVRNGRQAGLVTMAGVSHAYAWSGTLASAVDLNPFLPPGYTFPNVTGITDDGSVVGSAYSTLTGTYHAVIWKFTGAPPFTFVGFLQPINDPATPESSFKQGGPIQFKFRLYDGNGDAVTGQIATLSLVFLGATEEPVNEIDSPGTSDSGTQFVENGAGQYTFKLSTKNLIPGRYRASATIGSFVHSVTFSLR